MFWYVLSLKSQHTKDTRAGKRGSVSLLCSTGRKDWNKWRDENQGGGSVKGAGIRWGREVDTILGLMTSGRLYFQAPSEAPIGL